MNTPQPNTNLTIGHSEFVPYWEADAIVDLLKKCEIRSSITRFECTGSHCGATIYIADVKEALWTQIICPKCGRKFILSFNEEYPTKDGIIRGYYLEPAEKY